MVKLLKTKLTDNIKRETKKNILVVGGGKVGSQIANEFTLSNHNVVLVDQDENVLRVISVKFGGKTVLGDAANINTLIKAGIEQADVVVAATNNDNINVFVSLIAKEIYNTKKVISCFYDSKLSIIYDKLENITAVCPYVLSAELIKDSVAKETINKTQRKEL